MNILFVTPEPPFAPTNGVRLIVASLARELSRQHRLTLLTFGEKSQLSSEHNAYFEHVQTVPPVHVSRWWKWASSLVDEMPLWVRAYIAPEFRSALRALTAARAFDVAHFDTGLVAPYLDAVSMPTILAPHDCLTAFLEQAIRHAPRRAERIAARLQISKMRRFEATYDACATRVVMVTERERQALRAFAPHVDARVIPNGVDAEFFAPRAVKQIPHSIAFSGVMNYAPNEIAALFFVQTILPHIWLELPETTFTIIGRDPTPRVRALSGDTRIRVTGGMQDLRAELAAHEIIVAPMQAAGGIKNKVLEAMAMGKPIVATPQALEGIDARNEHELVIARNADVFAQQCVRLLRDETERARLAHNARAWALAHSWQNIAAQYVALYQEAILAHSQIN